MPADDATPLYLQIAQRVAQMVASGAFAVGQRLPSVRDAATQHQVSVATVLQAYRTLEEYGVAQPRPKSGYFVAPASKARAAKLLGKSQHGPIDSAASKTAGPPHRVNFAGYQPQDVFDTERIRAALNRASRQQRHTLIEYSNSSGSLALRNAVAQRALHLGCTLKAADIVIAASCLNAVSLCLQAVTQPGDMVAVESPTYFGFLDLLAALKLKPLPLPTDPRTGLSLPAMQLALDTQPVKALLLVPTLSNPLASVMPLTHKRALARLVAQYQLPLIEDVVFNDLLATDARRRAVKAYDADGLVMICGSFAKTVAPGIRLGWVDAGRWHKEVAALKQVHGVASNVVLEHALADLLTQGSYEAQLRRLGAVMKQRLAQARKLIQQHFPAGTKVNDPPAGYTLWLELPTALDSMALFDACRQQGIAVVPGPLFGAGLRYRHCLRLSFSGAWGAPQQAALTLVGQQARSLMAGRTAVAPAAALDASDRDFLWADEQPAEARPRTAPPPGSVIPAA